MPFLRGLGWADRALTPNYYTNFDLFGRVGAFLSTGLAVTPQYLSPRQSEPKKLIDEIAWENIHHGDGYQVARSNRTIKITLDRPHQGNALTLSLAKDLTTVFTKFGNDSSVHRIVLTARGRYFCTGMHLQEDLFTSPVERGTALQNLFNAIDTCPKTTIAAVNGPAFGGGVGLAMVCDIRLAVDSAYFCLSEAKLGLCPAIVSRYLVREWGVALVRMAMLTAAKVGSHRLYNVGALHVMAQEQMGLERELDAMLSDLMKVAPRASAKIKHLLGEAVADDRALDTLALRAFGDMLAEDSEARYGVTQFRDGNRSVNWDDC